MVSLKAAKIYESSLVCDMALGFEPEIEVPSKWDLLPRYQTAKVNFISLAIAGEFTQLDTAIHYIARHRNIINNIADNYVIVKQAEDITQAANNNKLALTFWLQGTAPLGNDINMVDVYYQLGIRIMLLCYNTKNYVGDGCIERTNSGLSNFGIQLISRMNQIGMLIDCSHSGYKTSMEIMETSQTPVIFSHSNVYELCQHPRNIKDDQIKACANTGGIIGINGANQLLGENEPSPARFAEHIDYIAQLVGAEHVGLGLDLVYFQEILNNFFQNHSTTYPANYLKGKSPARALKSLQPEQLVEVVEYLLRKNYPETAIKNILGQNFLRVASSTWK